VEILKGPAAIKYGPHTVGGAINFVTTPVPDANTTALDLSMGNDGYMKSQAELGIRLNQDMGVLIDLMDYRSDGFKELDNGSDTGFVRNDYNVKFKWQPASRLPSVLTMKVGFAAEDSDETYLGLSDADFQINPDQRYAASERDGFESEHLQLHLNYSVKPSANNDLNIKAYHNRFTRAWTKFDGFLSGTAPQNILQRTNLYKRQFDILKGLIDSRMVDSEIIDVTNNDRDFFSTGLQLSSQTQHTLFGIEQNFDLSLRLHKDQVERNHKQRGYLMTGGRLEFDGLARIAKTNNQAQTTALSLSVLNDFKAGRYTVSPGLRIEKIDGEVENFLTTAVTSNNQTEMMPGISVLYEATDLVNVFAGIHKGFSPAGPGADGREPEKSTNYELGFRFNNANVGIESVAFYSDYSNLLGRCRVSDYGCNVGEEFSGGAVEILGAEFAANLTTAAGGLGSLTTSFTYTYTESSFQDSFLSTFSQFGIVKSGDELPYLPKHIAALSLGLTSGLLEATVEVKYQSEMREEPGQNNISDGLFAESNTAIDLGLRYQFNEAVSTQLLVRNAADERAIVAHRPFGARPSLPRTVILRVSYKI
jgi:Fe(3+) dicitrate transport protein